MALVVEDGTGLEAANSYASFADWTAYWADRGGAPAGVQADVEAALVKATDFLEARYSWRGVRLTTEQALGWPRYGAYREASSESCYVMVEGVPAEVRRATIELARRALAGELAPDPTVSATGQTVVASRKKVGPIEVSEEFNGGASSAWVKRFPMVDAMLRNLTTSQAGKVYRA